MNNAQRATLERIFAGPVDGNLAWSRIESLLEAVGCTVVEGKGSAVTFVQSGRKLTLHRPHPAREALRYRVLAAREHLEKIGVTP
jgi:HicA toxin of bacterial toxin-antitoxin,